MSAYFNLRILGADDREHSSIVGSVAYTMRAKLHDEVLKALEHKKHTFDFTAKQDELFCSHLLLPDVAPDTWRRDLELLWTEAERAEIAKSTGRFRKGAQLAKVGTVHFDRVQGIPLWEQLACLEAFCKQKFVDQGVVVQIDVHPYGSALFPDRNKGGRRKIKDERRLHPNTRIIDVDSIPDEPPCDTEHILRLPDGRHYIYMPHAHLTISTRTVGPEGFSKNKARHLNPGFANGRVTDGDDWTDRWVRHQNEWYGARGGGPRAVKAPSLERKRTGKAYRTEAGRAEADAAREALLERLRDPDELLSAALEHQATFTLKDLQYLLRRAGMTPKDARHHAGLALKRSDVVPLYDVMTSERRNIYTRIDIRHQERMTLQLSDVIASNCHRAAPSAIQDAVTSKTMNAEQLEAFERHVIGPGVTFTQGRAGAGKSYMVGAVREAYEASGYRAVGLAPTNAVAADMKKDGFGEASTAHAAVFKAEAGKLDWDAKTLIVVDEAGMLDTDILMRLLRHVAASGAKLVMVGDDRQLSSVGRGGMWPLLTDHHGATLMNEINRQEQDWQKAASVAFSEGRIGDAVRAYEGRGHVQWSDQVEDAAHDLLEQYAQDSAKDPDGVRFIYAATNATVNDLNARVHELRAQRGEISDIQTYETDRGFMDMGVGDRIQFYANEKPKGIINGLHGRVIKADQNIIQVETDAGEIVTFDPTEYTNFGHGYAGTVYRGQGKTVSQAYCLYDSKFAWSAKSAYVAMTRHKRQVDLYVPRELAPDFEHLVRQVSREGRDGASLNWATKGDLEMFADVVRKKAPAKKDPYKQTWSKLWSDFVAKITDAAATIADPVRQAATAILDRPVVETDTDADAFDLEAYRKDLRAMAAYGLWGEYAELIKRHEVTEDLDARKVLGSKITAVQDRAEETGVDLSNDPRPAQRKVREDKAKKERLKAARQRQRTK